LEKKRAYRRYKNSLLKKKILKRSVNKKLVDKGRYTNKYVKHTSSTVHFFEEFTQEKIYKLNRVAMRCDGRKNQKQHGCSKYCMICNPHLFSHVKIKKVKNTLDGFDMIDFEEILFG
jgi:hypothetical protein